jgi:DNA-binding NtrC family response regulator
MNSKNEPFRILIVDDNREIRTILEEYLNEEGYVAEGAIDGSEALQKHDDTPFDLIITDLNMPGMGGIDLIKEVGKDGSTTEFIIITGYASLDTAIEAVKAGAFDYIVKPFRIEELRVVIKNVRDKINLKKANKQLFDKLKSFYFEMSRYKKWLDEDELAQFAQPEADS